jgi:transcription elongation factor Elf1
MVTMRSRSPPIKHASQNGDCNTLAAPGPCGISGSGAAEDETVVCSKCGQRFAIRHDRGFQDVELAKKQASRVTDQLVWDHIQERKHHGTIELPKLQ